MVVDLFGRYDTLYSRASIKMQECTQWDANVSQSLSFTPTYFNKCILDCHHNSVHILRVPYANLQILAC